jgi:hypothetical protein
MKTLKREIKKAASKGMEGEKEKEGRDGRGRGVGVGVGWACALLGVGENPRSLLIQLLRYYKTFGKLFFKRMFTLFLLCSGICDKVSF